MNPFFEKFDTPFGTVPFSKIKSEHFLPALEEGIKQDKELDYFKLSKQLEAYVDSLCACRESIIKRLKGMK